MALFIAILKFFKIWKNPTLVLSVFVSGLIAAIFVVLLSEIYKLRLKNLKRKRVTAIELNNSFKTQQTRFNAGYGVVEPLKISKNQVNFSLSFKIYFRC